MSVILERWIEMKFGVFTLSHTRSLERVWHILSHIVCDKVTYSGASIWRFLEPLKNKKFSSIDICSNYEPISTRRLGIGFLIGEWRIGKKILKYAISSLVHILKHPSPGQPLNLFIFHKISSIDICCNYEPKSTKLVRNQFPYEGVKNEEINYE